MFTQGFFHWFTQRISVIFLIISLIFLYVLFPLEIYLIVEGYLNSIDVFEFNKSEYSILQDESLINIPRVDFVELPTDVELPSDVESPTDVESPRNVGVKIISYLTLAIALGDMLI